MRRVEKSLLERVEAALETVTLLGHAAHDRYSRRGFRRMAARADAVLEAAEVLRSSMSSVLDVAPRDELLFEIREELRLRAEDGIHAAELRRGRYGVEVLLVGARVRHAGGPPRRWISAEGALARLRSLTILDNPVERLQDHNLSAVWSSLTELGAERR